MSLKARKELSSTLWLVTSIGGLIACPFAWHWRGVLVVICCIAYFYLVRVKLNWWIRTSRWRAYADNVATLILGGVLSLAILNAFSGEVLGIPLGIPFGLLSLASAWTWFYLSGKKAEPSPTPTPHRVRRKSARCNISKPLPFYAIIPL